MNKQLTKILVLTTFSLMVFFILTDDATKAVLLDSTLAIDEEDPTASISPVNGSIVLPTAEIVITVNDDVGVDLGDTTYSVEKDNTDITSDLDCVTADDGTTEGTITCSKSGGLDLGSYKVSVTPGDLVGKVGSEVTSSFIVSTYVFTTTTTATSTTTIQTNEFHVTTAAEFQHALTAARDNGEADTIWLAAGTYNASDNMSEFIYLPKEGEDYDLTIKGEVGTTADDVILDGNNVLSIDQSNASVIIEGITIRNGGRARVFSSGDVIFSGNKGGNVYVHSQRNIIFSNNVLDNGASVGRGDVTRDDFASGSITLNKNTINRRLQVGGNLTDISITDNTIMRAGGLLGSGIYVNFSGNLTISNNTISENESLYDGGGVNISVLYFSSGNITLSSGNITLNNNIISKNSASNGNGGGVYIDIWPSSSGDITLINNTITENTSATGGGGGVYIYTSASNPITLINNTIIGNTAFHDSSIGGGIYLYAPSSNNISLTNNTIKGNSASNSDGGGVYIYPTSATITLSNNIIMENTASSYSGIGMGGGVYVDSTADITLTNNIIAWNSAPEGDGGGVYIRSSHINGVITLTNNTIAGNETGQNGGGLYLNSPEEDSTAQIYNNIIWGNEGSDIFNDSHIFARINAYNNNFHVKGGRPFAENVNNMDDDPLFVNPELGDYRLLPDSPCIDKGTADAPELPSNDIEGDSRIIGSSPDIGADEFDPSAPPTTTTIPITTTTTTSAQPPPDCLSEELYGNHSEETELLRYLRDNVLSQTPEGQEIIRLYYEWSPVIVKAMEEDEEFKEEIKEMIDGILGLIGGE